jgi:hypothetical protein
MKVSATIKLFMDEFEVDNEQHANELINKFLDSLSLVEGMTWCGCDWEVEVQ